MAVPGMSVRTFPRSGDVRVATLNVWGWYVPTDTGIALADPDDDPPDMWICRQEALRAGLRELRPDLVAFQEVISATGMTRSPTCSDPGTTSGIRWAGIVNHKPSYHLAFEHERELQAVATAQIVEDLIDDHRPHVVLAGDFDAEPDMASMRFWRGRQSLGGMSVCYRDAWDDMHPGEPGHTFTPDNPMVRQGNWSQERGRRIDHVLVRCGRHGPTLGIRACERLFDAPIDGVWASDHFGVVADIAALT